MLDAILFTLGLAAGAFTHEAGHQVGAWIHGEELHWRANRWTCEQPCGDIKPVALYGLGAQALSSELLLLPEKRGPFTSGWLAWNIVRPLSLVVQCEADMGCPDMRHFERGDRRIIQGLFVAHSTSVALRWAWKDKPEWFEIRPHEDGVAAAFVLRW